MYLSESAHNRSGITTSTEPCENAPEEEQMHKTPRTLDVLQTIASLSSNVVIMPLLLPEIGYLQTAVKFFQV
jgi:hypothetical protein